MPLQGRRLPDGAFESIELDDLQRGDYFLTPDHSALWCLLPHDSNDGGTAFARLAVNTTGAETTPDGKDPSWQLTINDDGTITLSPSIHDTSDGGYHGFLVNGVWSDG